MSEREWAKWLPIRTSGGRGRGKTLLEAKRNSEWIGCLDFGTALSKVAMVRRKPRSELTAGDVWPLAIARREHVEVKNHLLLPSLVYITDDGHVLFGDEAGKAAEHGLRSERQAFVSPKQYLSTHELEELDEPLEPSIDPTRRFTPRALLALFLAHLLVQAGRAAVESHLPWPIPVRIARPAWDVERAAVAEQTLQQLVLQAFAVADELGSMLCAAGGVAHDDALSALSKVWKNRRLRDPASFRHVFELDDRGSATVLEATAVAAGSIRNTGRRVLAVADIGGGTSDFGAFMTGLPGYEVLAEIRGSSHILRQAGDHLDMLLTRHILAKLGLDPADPAGKGPARRLRQYQRGYKESLFNAGVLRARVGDDVATVTVAAFLADRHVQAFTEKLRTAFRSALTAAVECARQYPQPEDGEDTEVEILLTGGGHALPMVGELASKPGLKWTYTDAAPEIPGGPIDNDLQIVIDSRQHAVAIGGAIRDLPRTTAAVRLTPLALDP